MSDAGTSANENPQWEIGVTEAGADEWEHHYPQAETKHLAEKEAQRASDLRDPVVYMTEGPFYD